MEALRATIQEHYNREFEIRRDELVLLHDHPRFVKCTLDFSNPSLFCNVRITSQEPTLLGGEMQIAAEARLDGLDALFLMLHRIRTNERKYARCLDEVLFEHHTDDWSDPSLPSTLPPIPAFAKWQRPSYKPGWRLLFPTKDLMPSRPPPFKCPRLK